MLQTPLFLDAYIFSLHVTNHFFLHQMSEPPLTPFESFDLFLIVSSFCSIETHWSFLDKLCNTSSLSAIGMKIC